MSALLLLALVLAQPAEVRKDTIAYQVGKDKAKATCFVPAGKGPFPALLVLHGDFGATPWTTERAKRLAEKGYVTLVVDLYRGQLPKDVEEAHILDRGLEDAKVMKELKTALDLLAK